MTLSEYSKYDALGLAELIARKQISPKELAETAAEAIASINPVINAVVELYPDRIETLDEGLLGKGPFRGVPFLMKDVLRIGWSTSGLMGANTDREVAQAVEKTANVLTEMGHHVTEESPQFDGLESMRRMADVWFFGFDLRLEGYSKRTGRSIATDTLEPVTLMIYEHARRMKPLHFLNAMAALNAARRKLGSYFTQYDVWLSPTTSRVSEPWGNYNLGRTNVTMEDLAEKLYGPVCQFTLPHNITGTPSISLPLASNSEGLPIGIQLGARPANEHLLLQLATALEEAMPWSHRIPPLHASRIRG